MLDGDRALYAGLVRRYEAKVLGLCVSILMNSSQAEDAAQDVFVKAYERLASFQGTAAFSTWLYRIATNHCLDIKRRQRHQKTTSLDAFVDEEGQEKFQFPATNEKMSTVDDRIFISDVLARLSENARTVLLLREAQGLTYAEMADVLGCTLDAVKARLKRARQEARDKLKHFFPQARV